MYKLLSNAFKLYHLPFKRNIRPTSHKLIQNRLGSSYEGAGKTTIKILNLEHDLALFIDKYSNVGFKISNGITVLGPMIIFPRSVLSWKVNDISDIHLRSLSIFTIIEPKVDLLIIGVGDQINNNLMSELKSLSINRSTNIEILPTAHAASSFNFLNAEGRNVAAALIPPMTISATDSDAINANIDKGFYEDYDILGTK